MHSLQPSSTPRPRAQHPCRTPSAPAARPCLRAVSLVQWLYCYTTLPMSLAPRSQYTKVYCDTNCPQPGLLQYNLTIQSKPCSLCHDTTAFLAIQLGSSPNHFLHQFFFCFSLKKKFIYTTGDTKKIYTFFFPSPIHPINL